MNNKALTIIIPMYNVSQYIKQCLDSLTENKDILPELEILVINDGSTDDSGEKAQVYADRYPDSVILLNKENGGHGSALNIGIEKATGMYLRALDSDDWVKTDGLAKQIDFIKFQKPGEEVDIIINPSEDIWDSTGEVTLRDFPALKGYTEPFDLKPLADNGYFPFFWNAAMRTRLYKENTVPRIDEGIFYDDIEFSIYILPFVKTVWYLPDIIYQYRRGTPGQSMNPANKIKRQWMYEQVLETIYKYRNVGGDAQRLIEIRAAMMVTEDCNLYLLNEDKKQAKKKICQVIKKYRDIPIQQFANRKLKMLLNTNFLTFDLLSWFYKRKIKKMWRL